MGGDLYTEQLISRYRNGRLVTRRKLLLGVYSLRLGGLFVFLLFNYLVYLQRVDGYVEPIAVFVDVLILLSLFIIFSESENLYLTSVLPSRPIIVHEDGLTIPPIYFRVFSKNGGYIPKEKIAYITVRRWKKFIIALKEKDGYVWYNAPVEFIVHLTDGKKIRSGPRPAEVIREAVETMHSAWGVKVVQKGSGNGIRKRFIDRKCVELVEL